MKFRYAMKKKGTLPKDGFVEFEEQKPDNIYAIAVYNRLLTDKEIKKYKLADYNKPMKKLTKYRQLAGYTQAELANITGLSLRTIQGWELNGMSGAAISKAYKVATILNCAIEDLLEDEDVAWKPETAREFEA